MVDIGSDIIQASSIILVKWLLGTKTHVTFDIYAILSSWQASIDFNTVNTTRPAGMYFLIYP